MLLEGAHVSLDCAECHNGNYNNPLRTHVMDVMQMITMARQIQITLLHSSRLIVHCVILRLPGNHRLLTMMECISRFTAANMKENGICVLIVISIQAIILYSVVLIVMNIIIRPKSMMIMME